MTWLCPIFFALHALVQLSFLPFYHPTASAVTHFLIPEGKQKPTGSSTIVLALQGH